MNPSSSLFGGNQFTSRVPNVQFANQLQTNLTDVSSLFKQISKGSNTSELLTQAAKHFASTDASILSTEKAFHKLSVLALHLSYQQEAIQHSLESSSTVHEQLVSLNSLLKKADLWTTN